MIILRTKSFGIHSRRARSAILEKLGKKNAHIYTRLADIEGVETPKRVLDLAEKLDPNSRFLRNYKNGEEYRKNHPLNYGANGGVRPKYGLHRNHLNFKSPEGLSDVVTLHRYEPMTTVDSILEKGILKGNTDREDRVGGSVSTYLGSKDDIKNELLNVSKPHEQEDRARLQYKYIDGDTGVHASYTNPGKRGSSVVRWKIDLPNDEYIRRYNTNKTMDSLDEIRVFKNIPPEYLKLEFPFGAVRKNNIDYYKELLEKHPDKINMDDKYTRRIVNLIKNS